ncbi:ABC transporter permease [Paenibacillus sp. MWE-103]|uniref:ABC transporter permease n=1 Tax=Paenibacillus artemisiicola TaxID=1172618 RepID=A0ABS3W5M1_9BACL|nr:ABC transporter permease [Paenibacillus artemisiicola]MBO7743607.1 ABC transporter permease [Paenibacillus artemisiicola]
MLSVLIMLLRKMARNYWLVICLFGGMLICIALTSSMPIYKNAVLHHMLVLDLERSYEQTGEHPGMIAAQFTMQTDNAKVQASVLKRFDAYWSSHVAGNPLLHVTQNQKLVETVRFGLAPADPTRVDPNAKRSAKLAMRSGIEDHVRLVDGKLPSAAKADGVYEVMVTDSALGQLGMLLGQEYDIKDPKVKDQAIRVKPVAVIAEKDLNDPFWGMQDLKNDQNTLFLPERLFERDFIAKRPIIIGKLGGTAIGDYSRFDLDTAAYALQLKTNLAPDMMGAYNYSVSSSVSVPGSEAMTAYGEREKTLRALLWSLNVPLFILIAFYFFMVTSMLVERQQSEIAVLRSRGASRNHLVLMYAAEFGLLALAAFAIGPWLGVAFTRVLGATSTFLNFVDRGSMKADMDAESWKYAAGAVIAAWMLNLIPVFIATKHSIVDQKRAKARDGKRPVWQLFAVDLVLIAIALYGHYVFRQRMTDLVKLGLDGKSLSADPLLYTIPTLFILGFGLLMIRLYPLFVALVYRMGRRLWAPQYYTTLLLVIRRNRIYHGLMLFLILTVGTGIYNANTARTLNVNMEDQIRYAGGSDIVLRQHWENDAPPAASPVPQATQPVQSAPPPDIIHYMEPPFEWIESLPGVDTAAKVFTKEEGEAWLGTKSGKVKLVGIDTDAFGNAAWMKDGLTPYPFYDYLNVIASDTHAVLLSKTAADYYGAKVGDTLDVGWEGIRPTRLVVYGIVPYFPAFNPNPVAGPKDSDGKPRNPMLIVGHLDTIQNELGMEPYDVWLKLKPGANRQALLGEMEKRRIKLEKFEDTIGSIAESRMDPFRMAINGVMTLGFIISLAVSFLGFMLFWLLLLQGRMLQFGIYRAMGISFKQLLGMMTLEQLLTTGAGFFIGIATGFAAGQIYVPLFQLSFDPGRIVPPFQVISDHADVFRLGISTCLMLAAGLVILCWLLKRMNIHQAVKLGED